MRSRCTAKLETVVLARLGWPRAAAIASFEMAYAKKGSSFIESNDYAGHIINDTLFDMSSANRGEAWRGNTGHVLGQFQVTDDLFQAPTVLGAGNLARHAAAPGRGVCRALGDRPGRGRGSRRSSPRIGRRNPRRRSDRRVPPGPLHQRCLVAALLVISPRPSATESGVWLERRVHRIMAGPGGPTSRRRVQKLLATWQHGQRAVNRSAEAATSGGTVSSAATRETHKLALER